MNGYKLLADSYRDYLQKNELPKGTKNSIEKQIKALDIMADMDGEDILALYGTGAVNHITLGYAEKAMTIQKLPKGRREDVLSEIRFLHDTMGAEIAAS